MRENASFCTCIPRHGRMRQVVPPEGQKSSSESLLFQWFLRVINKHILPPVLYIGHILNGILGSIYKPPINLLIMIFQFCHLYYSQHFIIKEVYFSCTVHPLFSLHAINENMSTSSNTQFSFCLLYYLLSHITYAFCFLSQLKPEHFSLYWERQGTHWKPRGFVGIDYWDWRLLLVHIHWWG